jgi:WS/DGAT/MGAT family acyltransferase
MSGGGLYIYDPSSAPGGRVTFKGILQNIDGRLHLAQSFRQKLVRVPMDLDHPYWIEDGDFDLEYHVRHIALPRPGDWRQLCILTARLFARPLDHDRPLWEMYVIEGLDNVEGVPRGSYAVLLLGHHASMDGVSGIEMITALHDLSPDATPPAPDTDWRPERPPSQVALLARANYNNLRRPMHFVRVMGRVIGPQRSDRGRGSRRFSVPPVRGVPRTRFNAVISPHRVIEGRRFPLEEIKRIKSRVAGATVNDVILTTVGGALRAYLDAKGELPTQSLVAMAPISLRSDEEKTAGGNKVGAMFVTLGTDLADPAQRLRHIQQATATAKETSMAPAARELSNMAQFVPGGLMGVAARLSSQIGMANRTNPPYNTVVTNIPGPRLPLYSCGARLIAMYGFGMVHDAMGLMHIVNSYCGDLTISITADRDMMPDPAFYAQCLQTSFDELSRATGDEVPTRSL